MYSLNKVLSNYNPHDVFTHFRCKLITRNNVYFHYFFKGNNFYMFKDENGFIKTYLYEKSLIIEIDTLIVLLSKEPALLFFDFDKSPFLEPLDGFKFQLDKTTLKDVLKLATGIIGENKTHDLVIYGFKVYEHSNSKSAIVLKDNKAAVNIMLLDGKVLYKKLFGMCYNHLDYNSVLIQSKPSLIEVDTVPQDQSILFVNKLKGNYNKVDKLITNKDVVLAINDVITIDFLFERLIFDENLVISYNNTVHLSEVTLDVNEYLSKMSTIISVGSDVDINLNNFGGFMNIIYLYFVFGNKLDEEKNNYHLVDLEKVEELLRNNELFKKNKELISDFGLDYDVIKIDTKLLVKFSVPKNQSILLMFYNLFKHLGLIKDVSLMDI